MTEERKHRPMCAKRLVWFIDDKPVNCGLPCDCDNPEKWVVVPEPDEPTEGAEAPHA